MYELSLNIMDIVQNSIRARATLISISICIDEGHDMLTIVIVDNGDGMSEESRKSVSDPFFTTRETRKVGLGLPYYEMAANMCGGAFDIQSAPGEGARVSASFRISHIDRAPLGDTGQTIALLAGANPAVDFVLEFKRAGAEGFVFDTREIKELLEGVRIDTPEIVVYMAGYINENIQKITRGLEL